VEAPGRNLAKPIVVLFAVALIGFGLYKLVSVLPPHPKTLERDAVFAGFVGAILVVQEFVRETLADLAALAWVAPVVVAMLAIIYLLARLKVAAVVIGLAAPLITSAGRAVIGALPTPRLPNHPLVRYGPLILGFVSLTLGMFLQLRAIDLRGA
jgi:hypothetical protein